MLNRFFCESRCRQHQCEHEQTANYTRLLRENTPTDKSSPYGSLPEPLQIRWQREPYLRDSYARSLDNARGGRFCYGGCCGSLFLLRARAQSEFRGLLQNKQVLWFFSSAALEKLKEPVSTVLSSITITLLWTMACSASISTGMPAFARKVAALYLSVWFDLSRTARIFTPRLCASSKALAIGAEVNEYAYTRILCSAVPSSRTMASVAPPFGEK